MNDFEGLLSSDYGFKPQGKSAPMSSSRSVASRSSNTVDSDPIFGGGPTNRRSKPQDFGSLDGFDDVFGGPPKYSSTQDSKGGDLGFNFDSMFGSSGPTTGVKSSSMPVYDKPVYDDEVVDFDNVFASVKSEGGGGFDDLLGSIGGGVKKEFDNSREKGKEAIKKVGDDFDDLIPGFGGSSPPSSAARQTSRKSTDNASKTKSGLMDDPFVVLESTSPPKVPVSGISYDPLEEISKLRKSGSTRTDGSSGRGGVFNDLDPLDSLGKSFPKFSSEMNDRGKERSPSRTGSSMAGRQTSSGRESTDKFSVKSPGSSRKNVSPDNNQDSQQSLFDVPLNTNGFQHSAGPTGSPPSYEDASSGKMNSPPIVEDNFGLSDDVWLTVSEIPLFTQPTTAPPPSRPPPPRPPKVPKSGVGPSSINATSKGNEFSSFPSSYQHNQTSKPVPTSARSSVVSPIDELEDFARARSNVDGYADVYSGEDAETPSDAFASAAAMKEAMDRAEAKFRHAKELKERENAKASRSKEGVQLEKDERSMQDTQERLRREKEEKLENDRRQREREEEEREQRRLQQERERAREIEREREEKEREQRRLEKERERAREIEREREKARQAVDRATREARERAAAEARLKAERAAVEKANAQARERAERAAVQRAQAEARERAAAEAKERAEKAAAEARERANTEARERANTEARERSTEARLKAERAAAERAAAEARERAAAAARASQRKNEDDLESFFSTGSRPSSAPRPRANSSDPFDSQFQSRQPSDTARRTSVGTSSSMKKASSTTNIVDDLSSIFGATPSFGEFQEVEGESEERRRARLERQQRTQERAAKALAEKNQRDLQVQMEQAERHRIAETLDVEIKRWAAGKEGNLRALLSTMQYVLWPECGWQPVSLTDLITAAAVKKVYRKATLCIHPDKVQQKGANLQQKYIAEKVFDLLKEAWNKFNSEELF